MNEAAQNPSQGTIFKWGMRGQNIKKKSGDFLHYVITVDQKFFFFFFNLLVISFIDVF